MELFEDYRITAKDCRHFYLRAASTGVVTVVFSLLIILSTKEPAGPIPWLIFGLSFGLETVLWGAFNLNHSRPLTHWAQRLIQCSDSWFPLFLFLIRKLFIVLFFVLLWNTLQNLGLSASRFLNSTFALLLFAVPIKGVLREVHQIKQTERSEHMHDFMRYAVIILSTLLTASLFATLNATKTTTATDVNMLQIIVWLLAAVISITCILLFFSRLPRHKPNPAKTAAKTRTRTTSAPEKYVEY